MAAAADRFLIDSAFILESTHASFSGAPLLTWDRRDNTFLFGFLRDLLRLRRAIGMSRGVVVASKEAYSVTAHENIRNVLGLLGGLGFPAIDLPGESVLDVGSSLCSQVSHVVTRDKRLLQLAGDDLTILLATADDPRRLECMSPGDIGSKVGVGPKHIPTYLSLTDGPKSLVLTKRQGVRMVELFGSIEEIYQNLSAIKPRELRQKLASNKHAFLANYQAMKVSRPDLPVPYTSNRPLRLHGRRKMRILESHGFHSLLRLLEPSRNGASTHYTVTVAKKEADSYHAIVDRKGLEQLESSVLSSDVCAIDTESDSRDPRSAELLGVSFSCRQGEAFFVPVVDGDLRDMTQQEALGALKRILEQPVRFVGHNIKYDYCLLLRNGIGIGLVHFDTMLAAYDCYGDWDSFSLGSLSQKLLGKEIKSYRDIVAEGQTFLELPFREIVMHACEDADMTRRLYGVLSKQLEDRGIAEQYRSNTLSLLTVLGDMEYDGIPVNMDSLERIRHSLMERIAELKQAVFGRAGKPFDLDSQSELCVILRDDLDLGQFIGRRKVTLRLLEELAVNRGTVQSIVRYKRLRLQLRNVDCIARSVEDGKIRPLFSQMKSPEGRLSSARPSLFGIEGVDLRHCFGEAVSGYFRDSRRSLAILEELSEDADLRRDRSDKGNRNRFMATHPVMKGLPQDDLLVSIVAGLSDAELSRRYMLDHVTLSTIRHDLELRYSRLFRWLECFRIECASQGYAAIGSRRKYLQGLQSSNVEKRRRALRSAVRWSIQY